LGEEDEGWYARNENVEGIFMTCVRHRVRGRGANGEIMWLLEGSAVDSPRFSHEERSRLGKKGVDRILEDILVSV
jgi:hypothetical protein